MHQAVGGDRRTRIAHAAMGVVLVGAALRLAAYLAVRSLWLDEAMLANNIVGRTFGALLGPLGEGQAAPWLFLLGERAVAVVLGPTELALRLLPLVAGILLPWLVWLTTKQLADEETGLVAAAIAALSPLLLYYSNEVKPYGIDAFVSAALLYATVRVLDDAADRRRWLGLVVAGAVGVVAAFPSAFVLAACWGALIASADVRRSVHARRMLPLSAGIWAATFTLPYVLVIRGATTDAFLTSYFGDRFLVPWGSGALGSLWRLWQEVSIEVFLGREALRSAPGTLTVALGMVFLVACSAGLWEIWRRRGAAGALVMIGPMAIALVASALRVYPLTVRLWAFSVPFWAILAAAGVRGVAARVRADMATWVTVVATAGLLATAGVDAGLSLTNPYWRRAHMRPLIRVLEEAQRASGDAIYVTPRAAPQWLYYTTAWRSDPAPIELDSAGHWLEQRTCAGRGAQHARACQMFGVNSSAQYAEGRGFVGRADSTWADREISRLQAAAAPCGWMLMHMPYPGEPTALARAIETHGGHVQNALEGLLTVPPLASRAERMHPPRDAATKALRICFDGSANAAQTGQ